MDNSIKISHVFNEHPNALVCLPEFSIYMMVVYRLPSYSQIGKLELLFFLESFCSGRDVVPTGDFNLTSID